VIDTQGFSIVYRGAVDHAKAAVEARAAGEAVTTPASTSTPSGRVIEFASMKDGISYAKDIAPILEARCVECHSEGNIGPWKMSNYRRVKSFASMIRETVLAKRMPPWHADPHFQNYSNGASLTPEESKTLVDWIDRGAPRGEGPDPLPKIAANQPQVSEWKLGEPDMVLPIPEEQSLPATGVFDYRNFFVEPPIEEDKWLAGAEVLPGNREVVHHCLIFLEYPDRLDHMQPEWGGGVGGYFAGYGPGFETLPFPEDTGKFLPKGSKIRFQMHYTATGKPETDLTKVGLYFRDKPPEKEYVTRGASNLGIEIPANEEDVEYESVFYVRKPIEFWSMSPHMHYRGSRFKYEAFYPDGSSEVLLNVPYYDFNWQRVYRFDEPKQLPAGTKIVCTGAYNNSVTNPNNPNPDEDVEWGSQTWEEMFIGYFSYHDAPSE